MDSVIPYLSVKSAIEAIELYKLIFGATLVERFPVEKEQASGFGLSEDADLSQTTMHGSFKIGDQLIYISDNFSGDILEKSNVSLLVEPENLEEMKKIYAEAESQGCAISMKLEKQFWGDYFCSFKDPFGINWQMNFSPNKE